MQAVADLQERRAARSRITMMASPQRENGHLDVANELAEWIARAPLNGSQFRLLWVILRKTYGWQKKDDHISASQFQKATGLHKQVIARELRELAKRGYITSQGDNYHAKLYTIQKDYMQWDGGKVYTDSLTDEVYTDESTPEPNCIPISSPLYTDPLTDLYTDPLTTITKKTTKQKQRAESEDSGAKAPAKSGGTIRQQFDAEYRNAEGYQAQLAVLAKYFESLLGRPPTYGRLAKLFKDAKSGAVLFNAMAEASKQSLTDDPHSYVAMVIKNAGTRFGKAGQADQNSGSKREMVL